VSAQKIVTKELKTTSDTLSYYLGVSIATSLQHMNIGQINLELISQALADVLIKKDCNVSNETAEKFLNNFVMNIRTKEADENLKIAVEWLTANSKKEGVITLPSGLQYKIITPGAGDSPAEKDKVTVHYRGTLIDGTQFDSSYDRGEPASFPLNAVIKGWTEGLQLMKPGGKFTFYIPPQLAYGKNAPQGSNIKANSALIFEVELISIEKSN
jgi:FKBP-type peptidyl-prolyl cis-trans isomerase